jgi:hypothetical protein
MSASLDRGSVRSLARRFGMDKTSVMAAVHRVAARLAGSAAVALALKPRWSGVLAVDGKFVRVYDRWASVAAAPSDRPLPRAHLAVWICGIDCGTGDLPHYAVAEEETKIDLVMFFRALKAAGYRLKALVTDGNPDIASAARKVYGRTFVHQRCTRHFVEGLRALARAEEAPDRLAETLRLAELVHSIVAARDLESAARRMAVLPHVPPSTPTQRKIMASYESSKAALAAHLLNPGMGIPSTTNAIENVFRQLSLRLGSVGQFRHWRYAEAYLAAWALRRRVTPFTDARGDRRCRNGKSPLELAGCGVVDMFEIGQPSGLN